MTEELDWERVTEILNENDPAPTNVFNAFTRGEWCRSQALWMQERGIVARVRYQPSITGTDPDVCWVETAA